MRTRLAIIILHYKNYEETIACAECAIKQKGKGYETVIVDNGSNDGSYEILKEHFRKTPHVTVKKLPKNLGFARGNNAGIRYARVHLGAECCFVCNSDVVFGETLFEELLEAEKEGIGVLSPSVYNAPDTPQPLSVDTVKPLGTIIFTWLYTLYKSLPANVRFHILLTLFQHGFKLSRKLFQFLYKRYQSRHHSSVLHSCLKLDPGGRLNLRNSLSAGSRTPYRIQGCAFLLTREYFRHYDKLYPKTFLYGEELNLVLYLKKAGLKAAVAATSPVYHKGKQSSARIFSDGTDKKRLELTRHSLFVSLPLLFLNARTIRKLY